MRLLIKTVIDKVKAFPEEENVHADTGNRYIDNVNMLMKRQEAKGLATYGQLLQDNKEMSVIDRIEYLEEELVDALMYMEHLKESVKDINVPSKWIPCSERLPGTNGVYCITRKIADGEYRWYISDSAYFDGQNTWRADNRVNHGREYLKDVVAWMPLPEPYDMRKKVTE